MYDSWLGQWELLKVFLEPFPVHGWLLTATIEPFIYQFPDFPEVYSDTTAIITNAIVGVNPTVASCSAIWTQPTHFQYVTEHKI